MKDKIFGVALMFIFWLIAGIVNYICYVHLLNKGDENKHFFVMFTILCFCMFIINGVELVILNNKDEK
jgi:heme/copper-type cytochrome/quinol oxidase subunit 4